MRKTDLTWLLEDRVHLTGFDCAAIRALRNLQAVFGAMPWGPRLEFMQESNTNPAKVKCIDCWRENSAAYRAWSAQEAKMGDPVWRREFGPRRVVIDLRR